MRILYHHRTRAEDGSAVHIRSLQAAFRALGNDVLEVGPTAGKETTRGRSIPLPGLAREILELVYDRAALGRVMAAGAEFRPDLVYDRHALGSTVALTAGRRLGVPVIIEVNAPLVDEVSETRGLLVKGTFRKRERRLLQEADRVCAVSGVLADRLADLGADRSRIILTPNGVDLDRYDVNDRGKALRSEWQVGDKVVIGLTGFVRSWHRLDLLTESCAAAGADRFLLAIAGEGPARAEAERAAERAGVSSSFPGVLEHASVPGFLAACDVCIVAAATPYASPLKLFEYMAAGRAVLAPDQPNMTEHLSHEANAWLFKKGDAGSLAAGLDALAADADLRSRLGAAGRATVVERDLTWEGNAKRVLASLEGPT